MITVGSLLSGEPGILFEMWKAPPAQILQQASFQATYGLGDEAIYNCR